MMSPWLEAMKKEATAAGIENPDFDKRVERIHALQERLSDLVDDGMEHLRQLKSDVKELRNGHLSKNKGKLLGSAVQTNGTNSSAADEQEQATLVEEGIVKRPGDDDKMAEKFVEDVLNPVLEQDASNRTWSAFQTKNKADFGDEYLVAQYGKFADCPKDGKGE